MSHLIVISHELISRELFVLERKKYARELLTGLPAILTEMGGLAGIYGRYYWKCHRWKWLAATAEAMEAGTIRQFGRVETFDLHSIELECDWASFFPPAREWMAIGF